MNDYLEQNETQFFEFIMDMIGSTVDDESMNDIKELTSILEEDLDVDWGRIAERYILWCNENE